MKVNIINIIGKWFDLNEKSQDLQSQKIEQAKMLDDFEPKLKNCSTFGQVKTAFPEIWEKLYIGFIMKYLEKNKISLKDVKIKDETYTFPIETCLKSKPELKKEYNLEVSDFFRGSTAPLGFMRNLDTQVKESWADFRADLKAVNSPEVEKVEVEVESNKVTLQAFEQVAKALAQQHKTLGNKSKSGKVSPQDALTAQSKIKKLAVEMLEVDNSKMKFDDLIKML